METRRICQKCRKPLAADAPMGLCPECLIKAGYPTATATESCATSSARFVPPTPEALGQLFPQLEILGLLGQGGMGAVYKARQKQLNRVVALKILPPALGGETAFTERFTREAQALARLNHPGIVTLYEFGHAGGMPFFLMEFVDGVNLGQAMANDRISPREALSIVPQICDALQFAHDQGVVHRDIKPENILLDRRGRVKVADFGLALLAQNGAEPITSGGLTGSAVLTEAGKVVGTPRYMSPEQLERPAAVDHRADIYALGVVFYQMLTGELPGRRVEPPSKKVHVDVRLDEVVLRALEQKPERRFQHASDLKSSVETIAGVAPVADRSGTPPISRRFIYTATIAMLGIIAGLFIMFSHAPSPSRGPNQGTLETAVQTIRNGVGRQLREAGAAYDDLQVTVAANTDSATPFRVSYTGLRNFHPTNGVAPEPNGAFVMNYIGGGQWQGKLGESVFTVAVGSKDKIDLPFTDDPDVVGEWRSVDFVEAMPQFNPQKRRFRGELFLKSMTFLPGGKMPQPWLTWTKGVLIHHGDQTASHYEIRRIQSRQYLFLEWRNGDYTISGRNPPFYVLQKTNQ